VGGAIWLLVGLLVGCGRTGAPADVGPMIPDHAAAIASVDPSEVLETYATDPQPNLRAQAVRWRVRGGGEGPDDDVSSWVQRAVVVGLTQRGADVAALLAIARRADRDPWVRALAALARPDEAMAEALADYRVEASEWRRIPLALGAWAAGDRSAKAFLVRDLRAGVLDWNVELILAIGDHGDADVAAALAVAQGAAEPELELAIAAARLQLGDLGGVAALQRVIDGSNVEARLEVLDLLVHVPGEASDQLIVRAGAEGPELVTWYAELAGIDRGTTKEGRLQAAMSAERAEVRELALRFAAPGVVTLPWRPRPLVDDKRRERAAPLVESGLSDVDPRVRRQALESAAALGLGVTPAARGLALDADPQVRIAAAGLLSL